MSNYSSNNNFDIILNRLLSNISDDLDKRQGSIIYDALAPAAAELAQCYIALDVYTDQTYLLTAVGDNLDAKVSDYGLSRNPATYAERVITVYDKNNQLMNIDIGSRFSTPNEYGGYNFVITERINDGNYIARCEVWGEVGNDYVGQLLPLMSINNLGNAVISTVYKPGEDEESDDDLRSRALLKINQEAFSGNRAAYTQYVNNIDGVGSCKIFPAWNGGGTVKIAVVTNDNNIPSSEFIDQIQEDIDPLDKQGEGVGTAPIGHKVTVVSPDKLDINIIASIETDPDYTIQQLKSSITDKINDYIKEVQSNWSEANNLTIYTSRMISSILSVSQVTNVADLTINGNDSDLVIELNGTNVKFPMLGEVILNEA